MSHHVKILFISLIFVFLFAYATSGTRAYKQESPTTAEQLNNLAALEVASTVNARIWLADYFYSNPSKALVLDTGGLATHTSLSGGHIRANAASPIDSNIAYYLTADRRVWKTEDGGSSFTALAGFDNILAASDPNAEGTPKDIFTDPGNPERVWVLVDNGDLSPQCNETNDWIRVYRSANGGTTWTYSRVIDPEEYCVRRAVRGMAMGNTVYVVGVGRGILWYGDWHGVIYGSADGGGSWSRYWHNDLIDGVQAWDQSQVSTITTSLHGGGKVWYAGIRGDASNGRKFHGILRGAGSSWSYLPIEGCAGCFTANQSVHVSDIAVDARNPNTILALVVGHGLYRSNDGGSTWVREFASTQEAPVDAAWRIEADPVDSGVFWLVGKMRRVKWDFTVPHFVAKAGHDFMRVPCWDYPALPKPGPILPWLFLLLNPH